MVVLEGIGVGLLVPLMSLLLGGESATPMRPLQWMEAQFPDHSPGFYVAAFCVVIVVTIGLKNAVGYVSQRFSAALKRRVVVSLRDALFERLQRADLDTFDRRPGGELANIFLVETTRTTQCDRCRRGPAPAVGSRAVLRRRAVLRLVAPDDHGRPARPRARQRVVVRL